MSVCGHGGGNPMGVIDGWGWLVIIVFAIYIAAVFRLDLWLYEKGLRWHSDRDFDYGNVLDPNVQANVAKARQKERKEAGDDKDKNGGPA